MLIFNTPWVTSAGDGITGANSPSFFAGIEARVARVAVAPTGHD